MNKRLKRLIILIIAVIMTVPAAGFSSAQAASSVPNGTYTASVKTDQDGKGRMFYIASADKYSCVLKSENGKLTATFRLDGTGYDKLYMGTAEAAASDQQNWVTYTEDKDMYYCFTVPVKELDKNLPLAAYGTKGKAWHDHSIVFSLAPSKTTLKSVKAAGRGAVKLTWKTQNIAQGYQIQYAKTAAMKKAKTVTKAGKISSSAAVKKLTSGSKYYFRIRTYNANYRSGWSTVKSVKVK